MSVIHDPYHDPLWLQVTGNCNDGFPVIRQTTRLRKLLEYVESPIIPTFITVLSDQSSECAMKLRSLLFQQLKTRIVSAEDMRYTSVGLHLVPPDAAGQTPSCLLADCVILPHGSSSSHRNHSAQNYSMTNRNYLDDPGVIHRVLGPMTDAVFVANDKTNSASRFIRSWIQAGIPVVSRLETKPVLYVLEMEEPENSHNSMILELLSQLDLVEYFSEIKVERSSLSSYAGTKTFQRVVRAGFQKHIAKGKVTSKTQFKLQHALVLVDDVITHVSCGRREPFDFILQSRKHRPFLVEAFTERTVAFARQGLQTCKNEKVFKHLLTRAVASALVYDALPPNMHCFNDLSVFNAIYKTAVTKAFIKAGILGSSTISEIQWWFQTLYQAAQFTSAAKTHVSQLRHLLELWRNMQPNGGCYSCFCRHSEHTFACGHSLCKACFVALGEALNSKKRTGACNWLIYFSSCPFCGLKIDHRLTIKPRTAGIRILVINGNLTAGSILSTLQLLVRLQQKLGDLALLHELFDIAIGTDSGVPAIIGLYENGWSAANCLKMFTDLIFKMSSSASENKLNILGFTMQRNYQDRVESFLHEFINLKTANSKGLPRARSTCFPIKMLGQRGDYLEHSVISTFNSNTPSSLRRGYTILSGYMLSKYLHSSYWRTVYNSFTPTVQSSSVRVRRASTLDIVLQESLLMWPDCEVDFILSVEAGTSTNDIDSEMPYYASGKVAKRVHVLNVGGQHPSSISKYFAPTSTSCLANDLALEEVTITLVASLFFFELKSVPIVSTALEDNLKFKCFGRILTRIPEIFKKLFVFLSKIQLGFYLNDHFLDPPKLTSSSPNPNLEQEFYVGFEIESFTKQFYVHLSSTEHHPSSRSSKRINGILNISGSPFTIQDLISKQWPNT